MAFTEYITISSEDPNQPQLRLPLADEQEVESFKVARFRILLWKIRDEERGQIPLRPPISTEKTVALAISASIIYDDLRNTPSVEQIQTSLLRNRRVRGVTDPILFGTA